MIRKFEKESELSLEYVLPDYLGDVKRVLSVTPHAVLEGAFVNTDGAECSGRVDFELLYLDTDGEVRSLVAPVDFNIDFSLDLKELRDKTVAVKITQSSHRVSSARKVSFKCRILLSLICDFPYIAALNPEGAECESVSAHSLSQSFLEKRENEYTTTLAVPEELLGDFEILSSFGNVRITDSTVKNGIVTISGEYVVGALIKDENGIVYSVKRSIPFEEIVSSESLSDSAFLNTYGSVSSINLSVDEQAKSTLHVSFTTDLLCDCLENEEISVLCDAYYIDYNSDCEYDTLPLSTVLYSSALDSEIVLDAPMEILDPQGICDLFISSAEAHLTDCAASNGELKLRGSFNISGMACEINEDSKRSYAPVKLVLPFEKNLALDFQDAKNAHCECEISVYDNGVTISDEGVKITLFCTAIVKIFYTGAVQSLKSIEKGEKIVKSEELVYTVTFVEQTDSLFSLAKRYNTTVEKIARDNKLSESASLSSNTSLPKRLIIT